MPRVQLRRAAFAVLFLPLYGFLVLHPRAQAQQADESAASVKAPLAVDDVVRNLQQKNAERAAALEEFGGTRIYRMQYRGIPNDHDAEMVVTMTFHAPAAKQFSVISQTGSKFIVEHVFVKLLEGEQEATSDENRRRTALSTENYDFALAGYESSAEGGRYILDLLPKTKNKFLYREKSGSTTRTSPWCALKASRARIRPSGSRKLKSLTATSK